jgi:3-hydroxyisobutyrate dehydrogenase-like beta-hydroxyacid dehydrogenase
MGVTAMKLGFVGTGAMGAPMSQHLIEQGHELVVYDINAASMQPILDAGATAAQSPKDAADQAEIVFVSVPNNNAVRAAVLGDDGVIAGSRIRLYVSLCTTGSPLAKEITTALAAKSIVTVESPISGGPPGAVAGTLSVMASGPEDAFREVEPMLRAWGKITYAGGAPGAAQVLKLANNILSATALAATAEAIVMGVKGGLDPAVMLQAINAGSGRNSATLDKFPRDVLTRNFQYGAAMDILMKDTDLALAEGEALGVDMKVCDQVRKMFRAAIDAGMGKQDITSIVKCIEQQAGVEIPKVR